MKMDMRAIPTDTFSAEFVRSLDSVVALHRSLSPIDPRLEEAIARQYFNAQQEPICTQHVKGFRSHNMLIIVVGAMSPRAISLVVEKFVAAGFRLLYNGPSRELGVWRLEISWAPDEEVLQMDRLRRLKGPRGLSVLLAASKSLARPGCVVVPPPPPPRQQRRYRAPSVQLSELGERL